MIEATVATIEVIVEATAIKPPITVANAGTTMITTIVTIMVMTTTMATAVEAIIAGADEGYTLAV